MADEQPTPPAGETLRDVLKGTASPDAQKAFESAAEGALGRWVEASLARRIRSKRDIDVAAMSTAVGMKTTNELLAQLVDVAQADAERARRDTRLALIAAWAAVGITIVVGVAQIWVAFTTGQ